MAAQPVFVALCNLAADAASFEIDDTPNKILDETECVKTDRKTGKEKIRTGINTSGLIATLDDDKQTQQRVSNTT